MKYFGIAICIALFLSSARISADPVTRAVIPTIGPIGTSDTSTLRGGTWSDAAYAQITVTCYYNGTAPAICAGGGDFDRILFNLTDPNCNQPSGLDNSATIIQDHAGNCFYRKNFGLNGIVDARQCGVYGDNQEHSTDVYNLNNCLYLAAQNGIYRVYTGGGTIVDSQAAAFNFHDGNGPTFKITPPQGVELTCAISGTADLPDNDFRIGHGLSNALVLDLQDPIALLHDNASLADCNVVAGRTSGGIADVNPYSPAYWYPDCTSLGDPCGTDTTPTPHLRSAILEYSAFNPNETAKYNYTIGNCLDSTHCGPASASVGITITGSKNAVRNVTVMGFGTGYKSTGGGKGMIIDRLTDDSDAGISIDSASEATQISGFQIKPFLTNGNGDASLLTMPVTVLQKDPSSSKYAATVVVGSTATPDFTFQQDDTVWIATSPYNSGMMVGGAESAAGRWTSA